MCIYKKCLGCPTLIFEKVFSLLVFFSFSPKKHFFPSFEEARRERALSVVARFVYIRRVQREKRERKNVDKIRNEIEQGERPLVPFETTVDFSLVTLRGGAIVGLPNGDSDRPIRRTRRTRSWGGFSHQSTVVREWRGRL